MRKAVVWVIVLVFALGIAIGYYFNMPQAVQTCSAELHTFTTFIEGAGAVNAPTQSVIASAVGKVKRLFVSEGQRVSAGDAVLAMDDGALLLQLDEAVVALNAQKKAYMKQNETIAQSQREVAMLAAQTTGYSLEGFNKAGDPAEGSEVGPEQVDLARLKVTQVRQLLEEAIVKTALNGTVLQVGVREGELVPAGFQCATIASMDDVEIESVFADQDVSEIAPGMEVQLHGGCLGTHTCGGIVTEIVPMAKTQQSQTGLKSAAVVKIRPANTSLFQRLGASVELKVITGRRSGVSVPIEALAQDASGLYVYVIRKGRAYRSLVEVGVLDEAYAEITSGVGQGDVVALNPTDLRNGERVSGS